MNAIFACSAGNNSVKVDKNREFKKNGKNCYSLSKKIPLKILLHIGKHCYKTAFGQIWYDFKHFFKSYDQKMCFQEYRTLGGFAVLPFLVNLKKLSHLNWFWFVHCLNRFRIDPKRVKNRFFACDTIFIRVKPLFPSWVKMNPMPYMPM